MALRVVVGNLLDEASAVTMTPAADPNFPAEFLHDGVGQLGARFGSIAADSEVRVEFASDIPFGNGFETGATTGDVIASGSGTLLEMIETDWDVEWAGVGVGYMSILHDSVLGFTFTGDHGGNEYTLAVAADDSSGAVAKLPLTAKAGQTYHVSGWAVNASSTLSAIRLLNTATGLYLKADGTWAAGAQNLVVDTSGDQVWLGINAGAGVTFTLPDADALGADEVELELRLVNGDAGFSYFDDLVFQALPPADFIMIAGGHNIQDAAAPILWQTSADGSSWTTRAELTKARHQFFALLVAPVTAAYHRILFDGTPTLQMWMGDVVLGLAQTLSKTPMEPVQIDHNWAGQVRLATPGGSRRISNRGPAPLRRLTLNFRYANAAQEAEALNLWLDQVQGGEKSVVVMPSTEKFPKLAIYGDIGGEAALSVSLHGARQPSDPGGDLGGEFGTQDHYSDMTVIIEEGAEFEIL